ncbi:MAG: type II toxin-antitoxin system Phd/YefM family antitoxin [Firmicutes bacterium]|nr:type II toxin-antitoxin system Phd/YefM family antitoxin [Bacillota bacterium]
MPNIRPISDLRNHFAEITRDVQATGEPVFLTKNGVGTLVVMSMEAYETKRYEAVVYDRLREAELEARSTDVRYSHEQVTQDVQALLDELLAEDTDRA